MSLQGETGTKWGDDLVNMFLRGGGFGSFSGTDPAECARLADHAPGIDHWKEGYVTLLLEHAGCQSA